MTRIYIAAALCVITLCVGSARSQDSKADEDAKSKAWYRSTYSVDQLNSPDPEIRKRIVEMLGQLVDSPDEHLRLLMKAFKDNDAGVRAKAVYELGYGVSNDFHVAHFKVALPAVLELTNDPDSSVRLGVVSCLTLIEADIWQRGLIPPAMLNDKDILVRVAAAASLLDTKHAPQALKVLLNALNEKSVTVRARTIESLRYIGHRLPAEVVPALIQSGIRGDISDENVMRILGDMGLNAKAAIPELIKAMQIPDLQKFAADALIEIDPEDQRVADALVAILDNDPRPLPEFVASLASCGPAAVKAADSLRPLLKSKDMTLCVAAAFALAQADSRSNEIESILLAGLADEDRNVRQIALRAAQIVPLPAKQAIPRILKSFSEEDRQSDLGFLASSALRVRGSDAKEAFPRLRELLASGNARDQYKAVNALSGMEPPARELLPDLTALFKKGPESYVAGGIAYVLGQNGAAAKDAIPLLRESLKTADNRMFYLEALAEIGDPDAKTFLVEAVTSKNLYERQHALRALWHVGAPVDSQFLLIRSLADEDKYVRGFAIRALRKLPDGPAKARAQLVALLKDAETENRIVAASTILKFDPTHAEARALLSEAFAKDEELKFLVAGEMILSGAESERAMQFLLTSLTSRRIQARSNAAQTMYDIGPLARQCVPALLTVARTDPNLQIRWSARRALRQLDPQSLAKVEEE